MRRRSLLITVLASVAAIAAGIVLSYVIQWFPASASTQAKETDTLYHVLVIASVPIFVLVVATILYCVWNFRMRPGQEREDGPPIHGHTGLEVLWTAVPALLVIGLVAYSFVVLHENERRPAGPQLNVVVNARQFAWSFDYPTSVTGGAPVSSDELYLPKGESVLFAIRSADVIHGFWVPAFRVQIDAVPGITTKLRATPDELGNFAVVCTILCGAGHSLMRAPVHVVTPAAFHTWLSSQPHSSGSAGAFGAAPGTSTGGSAGSGSNEGTVGEGTGAG